GVLGAAFLDRDDFFAAALLDDFAGDARALNRRAADHDALAADEQHLAELHGVARPARDLVDRDQVLLGDPILLPAGADDCEHGLFPRLCRGARIADRSKSLARLPCARSRKTKRA